MKKSIILIFIILFILLSLSCGPPKQPPLEKERIKLSDWNCYNTQFTGRAGHVSLIFNDYKYIIGGTSDNMSGLNDVWVIGYGWTTKVATAEFSGRWDHTGVVFNQKMWVIGGTTDGVSGLNDVWYSVDGVTWITATASAGFSPRWGHISVVFNDKIWVIGGTGDGVNGLNDVWYTEDGVNWVAATITVTFTPRWGHSSAVSSEVTYDLTDKIWRKPKIWVIGGTGDGVNGLNDVWYSEDGAIWKAATEDAPFSPRWGHQSRTYITSLSAHLILAGGRDKDNYLDDVWSSEDGKNWIRQNNTNFTKRAEFSIIQRGDGMDIFSGYDGSNYLNNECLSDIIIEKYIP